MKKLLYCSLLLIFFFQACAEKENIMFFCDSDVKIGTYVANSVSSGSMDFSISGDATRMVYYVGESEDIKSFEEGSLSGIVDVDVADNIYKAKLTGLETGKTYSVFAMTYDESGNHGRVSSSKFRVPDENDVKITVEHVLASSFSVCIEISSSLYGVEYYLGKAEDREDFLNGVTENKFRNDFTKYSAYFYDLEPDTDYIVYFVGYDRINAKTQLYEIPVRTLPASEGYIKEFKIKHLDIYKGEYEIVPAEKCSKMVAAIDIESNKYLLEGEYNWQGDIIAMLESWLNIEMSMTSMNGESLSFDYITPDMLFGKELEVYVVVYDSDYNPAGVERFVFNTPEQNPDAGNVTVGIEVSDITSSGATYTYTPDQEVFGFMYETLEADWFDDLSSSAEYNDRYIHELLWGNGKYWSYGNEEVVYVEQTGKPNTRYYAVACPMNENGRSGWCDMVMKEYKTDVK